MEVIELPKLKKPPQPTDEIGIMAFGPDVKFATRVYVYADVLEELIFSAKGRSYYGMLMGTYSVVPLEIRSNKPGDMLDFIEITAFKNVYPCEGALDYADYLRKHRIFRGEEGKESSLGVVVGQKTNAPPTYEDLMLMRSYFADPMQIALYITEDGQPRVFVLGDESESFAEIGFSVIYIKGNELPFVGCGREEK